MGFSLMPLGRGQWLRLAARWIIFTGIVVGAMILFTRMPESSHRGRLDPLTEEEKEISDNLKAHVRMLADKIGERNIWNRKALKAAEEYIHEELSRHGYGVSTQAYEAREVTVKNIEAEKPGISTPDEIILVGAHYDSVLGSPGANDNGTGAAAVLELARLFSGIETERTLRFVAFVNEEPPFFMTRHMGSRVYAERSRSRNEKIEAMISIETIGFYSDEKGSQRYPVPFSFFYPDTADFIGFVSNLKSRKLVERMIGVFRRTTKFPSEGVAAPGWMTGIGWSDQWAFWKEGYNAIMVTDTALFRYTPYHTLQDTWEKVDYDRTARVVKGLQRVVAEIAGVRGQSN